MKTTITLLRTGSAVAAAGLLVGMLAACAPDSKPAPKPTKSAAFATDEEAFAAAEATYRAFIRAQNHVDLADASSFEPVYLLTVEDAKSAVRESLTQLSAENVTMSGSSSIMSIAPLDADRSSGRVSMHACVDVSDTKLIAADGVSLVPADRAEIQSLLVDFITEDAGDVKVSGIAGARIPC